MRFREDINGLRAIAVIAVVIFHFSPSSLTGGFAGVDVFFVISGYLMTAIIFSGIEKQKFSILDFYIARGWRIIPALAVLCMMLIIWGWFYLSPLDYRAMGKHIASSIGFLSNIVYWLEAGYFDAASHEKWLLHTWSLSVEWQFYILYPLLLVVLNKFFIPKTIRFILVLCTLFSFGFALYCTYFWPDASFYLLPSRAWEMLLGGLAFLYPISLTSKKQRWFEYFGLVCICLGYVFLSESNTWPSTLTLLPVLGAFLIICSNRKNSKILGNVAFQWIGKISYSLYLWHWPVVVFQNFYPISGGVVTGIILSVILGATSFYLIENKVRKPRGITTLVKRSFFPVATVLIVGILGSYLFVSFGIKERVSDNVILATNEALNMNPYSCMADMGESVEHKGCVVGNKNNIKLVILGDSHANALATAAISSLPKESNSGVLVITRSSCPTILNVKHRFENGFTYRCASSIEATLQLLEVKYSGIPVVVINRSSVYLFGQSNPERTVYQHPMIYFNAHHSKVDSTLKEEFAFNYQNTMCKISKNHPLYITKPVPEMGINVPKVLSRKLMDSDRVEDIKSSRDKYSKRNEFVLNVMDKVKSNCGATLLEPTEFLCNKVECKGSINNRPLYYDGDHLSEFGNRFLVPMFKTIWN
tara:strand:- start:8657 stop:10594 length:1938 start_codon:yes stop_codon:yes gene_type:complete